MKGGDSISAHIDPAGRELLKRLTIVLAFLFVFMAAFALLERTYSQKFHDITGRAQWIWARHRMSDDLPVAFFAAREFDLPPQRIFTHLKIVGDPEYAVYVNGRECAARRVGEARALDFYDISQLVHDGRNRIVVAVRAPKGVGGLLAAIDIAPETANWVVTDRNWKIYRQWHPQLPLFDVADVKWERPAIIGEPPIGRWNYLSVQKAALSPPRETSIAAKESFQQMGFIPRIRTRGGVAVAVAERARATAYDFGPSRGQIRLIADSNRIISQLVNVRFANVREELGTVEWSLRPVVFAPGESVVTTPEPYDFRYAMIFARNVRAEVVK